VEPDTHPYRMPSSTKRVTYLLGREQETGLGFLKGWMTWIARSLSLRVDVCLGLASLALFSEVVSIVKII
jgi:hypothetical protein